MAYSSHLGDTNVVVLALGWGVVIAASIAAMYFLGHPLWHVQDDRAASKTAPL